MRWTAILPAALFFLVTSGCAPPVNIATERAAIRQAELDAVNAANKKDVEQWLTVFAGDASVLAPNTPAVTGKEAIREWGGKTFGQPGFILKYQNDKAEVSRTADIGYTLGRYEVTVNDAKGKPTTSRSKYVTLWRKQPDGKWKVVAGTWNSDEPAPAPPKR